MQMDINIILLQYNVIFNFIELVYCNVRAHVNKKIWWIYLVISWTKMTCVAD